MTRAMSRVVLAAAVVSLTAAVALAQQPTTASETKSFEVLAVDANQIVVRLPEGTREITVPDDFRFMINGQPMAARDLRVGMKGTATITTRTTVTPVTVTEVSNGTVVARAGSSLIVRTDEGVRSFSQGDVDKRGVKIVRDGKPAQLSEFREGDRLSATIITAGPPRVLTEKEVQATLAAAAPVAAPPAAAPRAPAAVGTSSPPAQAPAPAAASAPARTLPRTASVWPLVAFASILSLAIGLTLTVRRRVVQ
jgi:hypothetical protein